MDKNNPQNTDPTSRCRVHNDITTPTVDICTGDTLPDNFSAIFELKGTNDCGGDFSNLLSVGSTSENAKKVKALNCLNDTECSYITENQYIMGRDVDLQPIDAGVGCPAGKYLTFEINNKNYDRNSSPMGDPNNYLSTNIYASRQDQPAGGDQDLKVYCDDFSPSPSMSNTLQNTLQYFYRFTN